MKKSLFGPPESKYRTCTWQGKLLSQVLGISICQPLQTVFKFQVLTICQVQPFLVLQLQITWLSPLPRFDLVLSHTPEVDEEDIANAKSEAHDDCDLSRHVTWCIFWAECLGTNDISSTCKRLVKTSYYSFQVNRCKLTVTNKIERSYRGFLGISSHIGADKAEKSHKRCRRSLGEVVTC